MKVINTPDLLEWQKQNKQFRIIDVRTEYEYNAGHIEGSELISLDVFDRVFVEKLADKDETIVCVCRSGGRSSMAVDFLNNQGYSNVYNLIGGYTMYRLSAM
ncbi:MAG: rhodanese-like domain-containing protein [Candidatus Magasanikbacteria bacterium]